MKRIVLVLMAAFLVVTGSQVFAETTLQGTGATFPAPVYLKWVASYGKVNGNVRIDYQPTGSGAGIKGITDKTVDFGGSDAPMTAEEIAKAGAPIVHVPTCAGGIVLAYNLPDLKAPLKLDGPTIGAIYLGAVKTWNDPKIAALNPGVELPNLPITTVHRTDGSGTTYVFTNYVAGQSDEFDLKVGSGKTVEWPNGLGGAKNDGVAQIIQATKGAIGYVEHNFAVKNKLSYADLKNKDGKFVSASPETVAAAGEGALAMMDKELAVNIWNQPGANAYPISSFTYILVYKDFGYLKDPAKAQALYEFLTWSTTGDGQKVVPELVGYAPLTSAVQKKVAEALAGLTLNGQSLKK